MSCECGAPSDLTLATSAYRRALLFVVILNLGMGVAEMIAGFLSQSQALKADALDFLGDGAITGFAFVAQGWSPVWRARSAFLQGAFLGTLGVCVLLSTAYRYFIPQLPEAQTMGIVAGIALAVNICATALLVPHRNGDANAKAVWLFSRNDALGNIAVILAGVLVGWTGRAWPDLVVAAAVALLFLHSSVSILMQSRSELSGLRA